MATFFFGTNDIIVMQVHCILVFFFQEREAMIGLFMYWSCSTSTFETSDYLNSNCGTFGSDDFDDRIYSAYSESLEKQSVLPILKQELQFKIQYNRLSRGEPELTLEEEAPVTYEVIMS